MGERYDVASYLVRVSFCVIVRSSVLCHSLPSLFTTVVADAIQCILLSSSMQQCGCLLFTLDSHIYIQNNLRSSLRKPTW